MSYYYGAGSTRLKQKNTALTDVRATPTLIPSLAAPRTLSRASHHTARRRPRPAPAVHAAMAAIGDKRKRFLGAGNDAMEVTSLVRSRVALPTTRSDCGPDGDVKYPHHPSPGTIWTSSRLALQNDATASRCVAFVASAGEVFRHAVPFAGAGERVEEGKGSLLKSTTVDDGVTRVVRCVKHASEIQSLALYDPPDGDDVVLASVDAYGGGFVTTLRRGGGDDDGEWSGDAPVRQYALAPHEPAGPGTSVPGWAGAAFDRDGDGGVLAVARHFDKAVDVYENGKRARTLRTTLCPRAVSFARDPNRRGGIRTGSSADGPPLLAVAEGNHVSLWDVRAREKGGLGAFYCIHWFPYDRVGVVNAVP